MEGGGGGRRGENKEVGRTGELRVGEPAPLRESAISDQPRHFSDAQVLRRVNRHR